MDDPVAITDPASALIGLGALAGLLAAWYWGKVATTMGDSRGVIQGRAARFLGFASMLSAFAMGLASFGYLLGRFSGRF